MPTGRSRRNGTPRASSSAMASARTSLGLPQFRQRRDQGEHHAARPPGRWPAGWPATGARTERRIAERQAGCCGAPGTDSAPPSASTARQPHLVRAEIQRADHDRPPVHRPHHFGVGLKMIFLGRLRVAGPSTGTPSDTGRCRPPRVPGRPAPPAGNSMFAIKRIRTPSFVSAGTSHSNCNSAATAR